MAATKSDLSKNGSLRLIVWAPSLPEKSKLPTLDPESLYAASLVQSRLLGASTPFHLSLGAPSPFLHSTVPCIEDAETGVVLAEGASAIDSLSEALSARNPSPSPLQLDEEGLSSRSSSPTAIERAKLTALETYMESTLSPLIYHILFTKPLFPKHTGPAYAQGIPFYSRRSISHRLASSVRETLSLQDTVRTKGSVAGVSWQSESGTGLSAILHEQYQDDEQLDREERERLAGRAGIQFLKASDRFRQAGSEQAFRQLRLTTYAEEVFDLLSSNLPSHSSTTQDTFLLGASKPSKVDLRLFSLLAPLLLPQEGFSTLQFSPIVQLLFSKYSETLVKYVKQIQHSLWPPIASSTSQPFTNLNWPILEIEIKEKERKRNEEENRKKSLSVRTASNLGRLSGETYNLIRVGWQNVPTIFGRSNRSSVKESRSKGKEKEHQTAAERAEARKVAWGRAIWIASALVGMVGTAFVSGLIAIEVRDVDEDGDDDGEETGGQFPESFHNESREQDEGEQDGRKTGETNSEEAHFEGDGAKGEEEDDESEEEYELELDLDDDNDEGLDEGDSTVEEAEEE